MHRKAAAVSLGTALLAMALAGAARAQSVENPSFVFSVSAGVLQGGALWAVARQPAPVAPVGVDTLALSRRFIRPSAVIALAGTYYRSPHVGYTFEASFLGLGTRATCAPVGAFAPDSEQINAQACGNMNGSEVRTSAVTFTGGLTLRAGGPAAHFFVRALGGFAVLGGSFARASGPALAIVPVQDTLFAQQVEERVFLEDAKSGSLTWTATLGGGATVQIAPGMFVGLEMADRIIAVPVPTGPGDPARDPANHFPVAPVAWRTLHLPTLTVVLELMLEHEHSRRY